MAQDQLPSSYVPVCMAVGWNAAGNESKKDDKRLLIYDEIIKLKKPDLVLLQEYRHWNCSDMKKFYGDNGSVSLGSSSSQTSKKLHYEAQITWYLSKADQRFSVTPNGKCLFQP